MVMSFAQCSFSSRTADWSKVSSVLAVLWLGYISSNVRSAFFHAMHVKVGPEAKSSIISLANGDSFPSDSSSVSISLVVEAADDEDSSASGSSSLLASPVGHIAMECSDAA